MFGSDIIEVAIGMAFLYLFMSMIASALREALEAFFQNRAKDLEKGIREMLRTGANGDPGSSSDLLDKWRSLLPISLIGRWRAADAPTLAPSLYDHPMVSSLYKGSYEQAQGTKSLPAYIPKENFATALLDIVAKASENGQDLSVATLRTTLAAEPNPNAVQRVVLLALSTAGTNLDKVQKAVEDWYDSTMQRVTSWYAKRTSLFLFVIGICAAVALNVDSITIVKRLLSDPPLRQAIVKQAETYAKDNKDLPKSQTFDVLRQKLGEVGYPIGWARQSTEDPVNATDPVGTLYPIPQACTVVADDKTPKTHLDCHSPGPITRALALMGWLITAIAIMLGAPFWFDLLKKLISLRTSINPDEDAEKDTKKQSKSGKTKRNGNQGQGGDGQGGGGQGGGGQGGGGQGGGGQGGGGQGGR